MVGANPPSERAYIGDQIAVKLLSVRINISKLKNTGFSVSTVVLRTKCSLSPKTNFVSSVYFIFFSLSVRIFFFCFGFINYHFFLIDLSSPDFDAFVFGGVGSILYCRVLQW